MFVLLYTVHTKHVIARTRRAPLPSIGQSYLVRTYTKKSKSMVWLARTNAAGQKNNMKGERGEKERERERQRQRERDNGKEIIIAAQTSSLNRSLFS